MNKVKRDPILCQLHTRSCQLYSDRTIFFTFDFPLFALPAAGKVFKITYCRLLRNLVDYATN